MSVARGGKATSMPPRVLQRFWPHPEATMLAPAQRDFLIGRLLEEGDADELRWLVALVGRDALADFVRRHGTRALSHRSRGFWAAVLGLEPAPAGSVARALWPLA